VSLEVAERRHPGRWISRWASAGGHPQVGHRQVGHRQVGNRQVGNRQVGNRQVDIADDTVRMARSRGAARVAALSRAAPKKARPAGKRHPM